MIPEAIHPAPQGKYGNRMNSHKTLSSPPLEDLGGLHKEETMYLVNLYAGKTIISDFAEDRGKYIHSGVDYVGTKQDDVFVVIDGVIEEIGYEEDYFGRQCIIKSNPKYAGGVDDILFHSYCHLHNVIPGEGEFVKWGAVLGKMGNSGGCYTGYDAQGKYTGKYRKVTKEEQNKAGCNYGVHLHLYFYQWCKKGDSTPLLDELQKLGLLDNSPGKTYFYQWGQLMIAPDVIDRYFKLLTKQA